MKVTYLRKIFFIFLCISFFPLSICYAENEDNEKQVRILGSASIEFGQIVKGRYLGEQIDHVWLSRPSLILGAEAFLNQKLRIGIQLEGEYWYDTYPHKLVPNQALEPFKNRPNIILREAQGTYSFIDSDNTSLKLSMGVFPFKYNDEARNLGEYLFRSRPYPNFVYTSFDFAEVRLYGANIYNSLLKGMLSQNLILYSEMETQPLHDFSLSYLAEFNLKEIFNLGAGVSFYKLFPVNKEDEIKPPKSENIYLPDITDTTTDYYSFQGTMLDLYLCFDIKKLFKTEIFGENDLKLYAEAAILGVKSFNDVDTINDRPNYYKKIGERIPFMFGFNIPTFKIFEVITFELEYYHWKYPISPYNPTREGNLPLPVASYTNDSTFYEKDNWKWSVYAKCPVVKGWNIIAQFARDHSHHRTQTELHRDVEEIINRPRHWIWMGKIQYEF